MFAEAQACLAELYIGGRVRELLAQGVTQSRFHERSVEQEKLERRRQMPFHMHINLELLEKACTSVLHAPGDAVHGQLDAPRAPSNKPFARLMDNYERQTFNGPPENVRDHIMAATRCMLNGEWRRAKNVHPEPRGLVSAPGFRIRARRGFGKSHDAAQGRGDANVPVPVRRAVQLRFSEGALRHVRAPAEVHLRAGEPHDHRRGAARRVRRAHRVGGDGARRAQRLAEAGDDLRRKVPRCFWTRTNARWSCTSARAARSSSTTRRRAAVGRGAGGEAAGEEKGAAAMGRRRRRAPAVGAGAAVEAAAATTRRRVQPVPRIVRNFLDPSRRGW